MDQNLKSSNEEQEYSESPQGQEKSPLIGITECSCRCGHFWMGKETDGLYSEYVNTSGDLIPLKGNPICPLCFHNYLTETFGAISVKRIK